MAKSVVTGTQRKRLINTVESDLGDLDLNDDVKAQLNRTYVTDMTEYLEKKQEALTSVQKLLNISERYSTFCNDKINSVLKKSEQERVESMMSSKKSKSKKTITSLPHFKGVLKDYQVIGVDWMKCLVEHGVNGILADEMGLGKTIQVIALICHFIQKIKGPILIAVPLSTLPNWNSEFERFAPDIPIVKFHGNQEQRCELMRDVLKVYKVGEVMCRPVVITTVQMIAKEIAILRKITWKILIVDEGQSLKNYNAQVSKNMRLLRCINKFILTGTPLQNNLTELWSLLNFIMPNIFKNIDTFSSLFLLDDFRDNSKIIKEEETSNIISSLHKILQPFLLRRLKSDVLLDMVPKKEVIVYCPLTSLQRKLYMYTLKRNINAIRGIMEGKEDEINIDERPPKRKCVSGRSYYVEGPNDPFLEYDPSEDVKNLIDIKIDKDAVKYCHNITMSSPLSMFKKIVNHPYLVHMPVTEKKEVLIDEHLITESGKMLVLEALLRKLKRRGHKVLIFSTMVMLLDLIEEVLILRNYTYSRLDGNYALADRAISVNSFNTDPNVFAFLISTRAGGLGLNLTAADTVILFDRDWNPQADIQAQDRCHRIGQTKPIVVYSLITKNTIDERIINLGNNKKKLEKVVIKGGKFKNPTEAAQNVDLEELLSMLDQDDSETVTHQNSTIFSKNEWDSLLDRSALYAEMERRSRKN